MIKYLYSGGSFRLVSWNGLKIDQIFIRCSAFWTNNRMRIWFIAYIYFYSERKMSFDSRELQTACVLNSIYWQTWKTPSQSSWLSAQLSFKCWKFHETSNKYSTFHRPFNSEAIWSTSRHFLVPNMQIQKKVVVCVVCCLTIKGCRCGSTSTTIGNNQTISRTIVYLNRNRTGKAELKIHCQTFLVRDCPITGL